jgi:hypothetical protein
LIETAYFFWKEEGDTKRGEVIPPFLKGRYEKIDFRGGRAGILMKF